jgi:hypothetical protein
LVAAIGYFLHLNEKYCWADMPSSMDTSNKLPDFDIAGVDGDRLENIAHDVNRQVWENTES